MQQDWQQQSNATAPFLLKYLDLVDLRQSCLTGRRHRHVKSSRIMAVNLARKGTTPIFTGERYDVFSFQQYLKIILFRVIFIDADIIKPFGQMLGRELFTGREIAGRAGILPPKSE